MNPVIKQFREKFPQVHGRRLPKEIETFILQALKEQENKYIEMLKIKDVQFEEQREEEYKKGYNTCLEDQRLTGREHQHLYL